MIKTAITILSACGITCPIAEETEDTIPVMPEIMEAAVSSTGDEPPVSAAKAVMPLAATATTGRKTAGALFRVFFITTPLSLDFFKYIDYRMDAQPHKKRDAAKQETNAYKLRD